MALTRLPGFTLDSNSSFTFANASVTSNVTAGNIKTDNLLYANGSPWSFGSTYANSNVESYLPTYTGNITGNILTLTGNVTAINANLGNVVSANYFTGALTTPAQPNITSVGTLTSLTSGLITATSGGVKVGNIQDPSGTNTISLSSGTVTMIGNLQVGTSGAGNVTATYFIGNGSQLTGLPATYSNTNVASYLPTYTGNIAAGNISTSGTLSAGDATITGNLVVNGTTVTANVTTINVKDPIIEMGGNTSGGSLTSNDGKDRGTLLHYYSGAAIDAFMGWDNSNAEFAFASNVSLSSEVATFNSFGNVRASYFLGNGSQLTGTIASAASATTAETVTTNAQPNITSIGTLTSLSVTANITSGNIAGGNAVVANYFVGDGSLLTGLPASYANANVANYLPTYTGNFNPSNLVVSTSANLGAVGNVIITGGTANYVLTTDGAGTLSWAAQSGGGSSTSTTIAVDNFTGNGVADTYTLSVTPTSVNSVFVNYNGAFVGRGSYSLSGANLTFGSVPANGASIEVTTIEGLTIGSGAFTTRTATGDGSDTTYTVTSGATESSILVTLDGVLQTPTSDYTISGTTLTFTTAPYNGAAIQIRELAVASSSGGTGGASRAVAMTMGIIFGG